MNIINKYYSIFCKRSDLAVKFFVQIKGLLLLLIILSNSCKKEETNIYEKQFQPQLKAVTDSLIENTHLPGAVVIVHDYDRNFYFEYAAGLSDIENNLPMQKDYTFRIASITKTFTGTVLLQLVDEAKLSLDDKLSDYFPQYPKADSVTIKMLSNMTSGIYDYLEDSVWWQSVEQQPYKVWEPYEIVDVAFQHPYLFSPGKHWCYSNTNTFLIGMIIEQITANSLQTEIQNRIISPMEFSKTAFMTNGVSLPGSQNNGYYNDVYILGQNCTQAYDISSAWAAGSIYSTPLELALYAKSMVAGEFISESLQNQRLNDFVEINENIGYGLFLMKRKSFYGHSGSIWGFSGSMYHSNEKNCTVVILFNACLTSVSSEDLFLKFMDILYDGNY